MNGNVNRCIGLVYIFSVMICWATHEDPIQFHEMSIIIDRISEFGERIRDDGIKVKYSNACQFLSDDISPVYFDDTLLFYEFGKGKWRLYFDFKCNLKTIQYVDNMEELSFSIYVENTQTEIEVDGSVLNHSYLIQNNDEFSTKEGIHGIRLIKNADAGVYTLDRIVINEKSDPSGYIDVELITHESK